MHLAEGRATTPRFKDRTIRWFLLAGLAVAEGMDDDQIEAELPERVRQLLIGAINDLRGNFQRSVERAPERLHFICNRD